MSLVLTSVLLLSIVSLKIGRCDTNKTTKKPIRTLVNIYVRFEGLQLGSTTEKTDLQLESTTKKKAGFLPQCRKSDPELEKCIKKGMEVIRLRLRYGIPELHIPAMEPFAVPTVTLDYNTYALIRINGVLKNMLVHGGTDFVVDELKPNLNNKYAAEVRLSLPRVAVVADYDVRDSNVNTFVINSDGKIQGNFTNISVIAKGTAQVVEKEGVRYLQADNIDTKVTIGDAQVAIENSRFPQAAASAAGYFKDNKRLVLNMMSPLLDATAAAILKAFVNQVLLNIPLHEVLLEE